MIVTDPVTDAVRFTGGSMTVHTWVCPAWTQVPVMQVFMGGVITADLPMLTLSLKNLTVYRLARLFTRQF